MIPNKLSYKDLIDLRPYELNLCGECFLKCELLPIYWINGKVKTFWQENQYRLERKFKTIKDYIKDGCFEILMQNIWVKKEIFKPSILCRIKKYIANNHL